MEYLEEIKMDKPAFVPRVFFVDPRKKKKNPSIILCPECDGEGCPECSGKGKLEATKVEKDGIK